jgi:CheY-like chemotaxis protein
MKILVIDDNKDIIALLVNVLSIQRHEVIPSHDGREGLRLIQEEKFDMVLLDIDMPKFSGLDVIDELIKNDKMKDNTIVLFTATSIRDTEVNELIKKGIHSCLRKPVRLESLFQKIDEIKKLSRN